MGGPGGVDEHLEIPHVWMSIPNMQFYMYIEHIHLQKQPTSAPALVPAVHAYSCRYRDLHQCTCPCYAINRLCLVHVYMYVFIVCFIAVRALTKHDKRNINSFITIGPSMIS